MKFLVDECVGPAVADWLKDQGYDVVSVHDSFPGITDDLVLKKAATELRIIITSDKDFGEMVFRNQKQHCGIILLRILSQRSSIKLRVMQDLLDNHRGELEYNFVVVSETSVRVIKPVEH